MTVDLTTAKTGIFARLGKIFGIVKRVEQFQDDIIDNDSQSFQEALNEYVPSVGAKANTALDLADSLISGLDGVRNQAGAHIINRCQAAAVKTLVRMVDADTKIAVRNVRQALIELNKQMIAATKGVDGTTITVGATSAAGSGTGTAVIGTEADNRENSGISQYPTIRTELLEFRCMKDSSTANIPSGGEIFQIKGEQPYPFNDHRWPGGTGIWGMYPATSDLVSDGQSAGVNVLRNSSYNSFDDANGPVNWEIKVGSAGATIFENNSSPARGVSCLQLRNDGSTNIRLHQRINSKSQLGSRGKISADGLYCISCLIRRANTSPSAGQIQIGLMQEDGTIHSGNVLQIDHGDIGTSYALKTFVFRVSLAVSQSPLFFGIKVSTAFTNGCHLDIDGLVCARMYQNGPSSPGCLIVPGTTDFRVGDKMTAQITNNGEGEIEKFMDRMFNTYRLGVYVPHNTGGTETVADTLVS